MGNDRCLVIIKGSKPIIVSKYDVRSHSNYEKAMECRSKSSLDIIARTDSCEPVAYHGCSEYDIPLRLRGAIRKAMQEMAEKKEPAIFPEGRDSSADGKEKTTLEFYKSVQTWAGAVKGDDGYIHCSRCGSIKLAMRHSAERKKEGGKRRWTSVYQCEDCGAEVEMTEEEK
jgi:DNA-directed RNA polymerase subunit RPC12/RpoP